MRLRILRRHINAARKAIESKQLRSENCPIAQALKERTKSINVRVMKWWATYDDLWGIVDNVGEDLITNFDKDIRGKVNPVTITIPFVKKDW